MTKATALKPESKTPKARESVFRRIIAIPEVGILIPLIGFVLFFYLINQTMLAPKNIANMLRAVSFVGVIALGQTFLMISGEFDLSVGATAGLAAIVSSQLMVNEGWSVPMGILAGLASGAAVGIVNSFVVLKMGVPAFIATLGMLYMAKGVDLPDL